MDELHDMHCHLDFMPNGEEVAAEAGRAGMRIFANTVTPESWDEARGRFAQYGNVTVGFGMHPWWAGGPDDEGAPEQGADGAARREASQRAYHRRIAEEACARAELSPDQERRIASVVSQLEAAAPSHIGEIGLDFGWRHQRTRLVQTEMFKAVAAWAAGHPGTVLSVHSIRAAAETVGILGQTGALEACTCIFHWFSGPSDMLKQAVGAGCLFSCGKRMLATGKGREYVKAIPIGQLLLETDAPPSRGEAYPFAALRDDLAEAARGVAALKGEAALDEIAATSRRILNA